VNTREAFLVWGRRIVCLFGGLLFSAMHRGDAAMTVLLLGIYMETFS
jgi:hypothetical protein